MAADSPTDPNILAVSEAEASRRTGFSTKTLYRLRIAALLPFVRVPGGSKVLYAVTDLEKLIAENRHVETGARMKVAS
jgi:hypothetical protein